MDNFETSLVSFLPNLRRFAITLSRSADVADDLVQITCQKAINSRESFIQGTRFDAWLFTIMRNSWLDHVRSSSVRTPTVNIDDAFEISGEDGRDVTEHRLLLKQTMHHIAALPDDQREVLLLVCVEELSYKEVADVTNVPVGTVMSRLSRARKKLAEEMGINSAPDRSALRIGETDQ